MRYIAKYLTLLISISLLTLLPLLFTACESTGSTSVIKPDQLSLTPATTPEPSNTLLYASNWSLGLDHWQASPGWKLLGKNLQTEPLNNLSLTIPYQPAISNYAIEVPLQIVHVAADGGNVIIGADRQPGKDGYRAGILELLSTSMRPHGSHPHVQAYIDPFGSMERGSFDPSDYEPGTQWHTFRIEIMGAEVSLFIDGQSISNAISTKTNTLSNGPIHLTCSEVILRLGTIRITTL
ncbi:hypothetical protein [Dictyobacter kobayashii]|uniref:3-keto-disaccharide hydrolase domain-containing protein n=1 Tax=Dictyobacter kobayashii TaxID=2014872 RepID=A0A402AW85_9CHLR|nr:hypothetical protein [Dictyobacter kobayashii]GCE23334.1 hypothetical protein KDK_71340 [Dictyobacter kobayashii]